ncbi:uroporphyrinogen-III C-methyltransferase [Fibrobacter sp. UWH1]|uniref:uroporphyrinogen-III C-methyltransferase n=1 Tax=Fibrobacter sp. UWH1 TaxID=1964354 RepID=UPI000B52045E|nr:uroporphyrinogen-III C-methyltransferase [Fibrobacter sp. UWH1]OWV15372.1 uroporphyrinogen-III C-methyltransferase [Fibrobacter sp. UWH1]
MKNFGKVYLIGAGPGDPGLFTLKGKSILERADVVVYDRLVSPAILSFCNASAEMVDVGKMPTHHKVKQSEINKLLVKFAQGKPGAVIARLKGGDPFVFGRGGEEALELIDAGVEFEVVPGITSAISVPAYAGIPVSHRGIATSFHIVTGHEKQEMQTCHSELYETKNFSSQVELCPLGRSTKGGVEESSISGLDFPALAKCPGTLIFLMGISNMEMISRRLIECGKDPKTPLAFIEKGTTPYQRTVMCTLETAGETILRENVTAPAITIMGGVVELGKILAWRKNLPLSGKRLVVTRAAKQASGIAAKLSALGAEVIETPMIETRTLCEESSKVVLADLSNFDVLAFTSTNGVDSFFELLFRAGLDIRSLAGKKIASVGKITEKKLLERGIRCDYVPEDHTGEGLGKLLAAICHSEQAPRVDGSRLDESRILLLQGNLADDTILKLLPKATRWVVYETLPVATLPDWKREAVAGADAVVFASSSAVENFMKVTGCTAASESRVAPKLAFSIGRLTSATAKKYDFEVVESEETSMDSLVKKIAEYYSV